MGVFDQDKRDADRARRDENRAKIGRRLPPSPGGGNGGSGGGNGGGSSGGGSENKGVASWLHNEVFKPLDRFSDDMYNAQSNGLRSKRLGVQSKRLDLNEMRLDEQIEAARLGISVGKYRKLNEQQLMGGGQFQGAGQFQGGQFQGGQFQGGGQFQPPMYQNAPQGNYYGFSNEPYGFQPGYAPAPQVAPVAPAPVVTAPPAAAAAPQVTAPTTAAPETKPAPEAKPAAAPAEISEASGKKTATYRFNGKAPKANEIPNIAKNQVKILQNALIEAGFLVGPTGADGLYGTNTDFALREFAKTMNPPVTDLTTLDFIGKNEASKDFLRELGEAIQKKKGTKPETKAEPEVKAPAPEVKPAGPTPDQIAAQRFEQSIPPAVRGTNFDPRNIASLNQQQRYDLARHALHGLDELSSENSRPNLERMHDKMDESVRWVNKHLGMNLPRPSPSDPLSNEAMYALGLRAAAEGGLSTSRGDIVNVPQGMTQGAMDRLAVQYIKALDRGVSSEDPSRAIRKFEKEDMGRGKFEADGLADPEMLDALRKAVAVRNGLIDVQAGSPVFAAPLQTQAAALPVSVTGGAETQGPQGASANAPTGQAPGTQEPKR